MSEEKKSGGFFKKFLTAIGAMFAAFVGFGILMSMGSKGIQEAAKTNMDNIYTQVTNDQIAQYNMTKSGGDKIEICVHAGLVVAGQLQAKNQAGYAEWKAIQRKDCATAGMPAQ